MPMKRARKEQNNFSNLHPEEKKRCTLAFLADWLDNPIEQSLLESIQKKAVEEDINLIIFEGGAIGSTRKYESNRNIIYSYIPNLKLDGIIMLTGALGHFIDSSSVNAFFEKFLPVPIISISYELDRIPSLFVDNKEGIKLLTEHFIKSHNFKKIAYISGPLNNQEAQERLDAFLNTLKNHHMSKDDRLIYFGDFTISSGEEAVKVLLDERKAEFDAVIAANDDMAAGAIKALTARGIKVPAEVAVGGFDNSLISVQSFPPLTTVNQSLIEQGTIAIELLLKQIRGEQIPAKTLFKPQLVVRESCGCFSNEITHMMEHGFNNKEKLPGSIKFKDMDECIQYFIDQFNVKIPNPLKNKIIVTLRLFSQFLNGSIDGRAYLLQWNNLIYDIDSNKIMSPHRFVTEFRSLIMLHVNDSAIDLYKADTFFHLVRILIGEKFNVEQAQNQYSTIDEFITLHNLNGDLMDVYEENSIMKILSSIIPKLGIPNAYISLYDGKAEKARLYMGIIDNLPINIKNYSKSFPAYKLLPEGLLPLDRRYSIIIETLSHHDQLGIAVFELGPVKGRIYGELRRIISTKLQSFILFDQVKLQKTYLKEQNQRLNELRQIMSGFIQTLAMTVEARDPYTAGHQHRVASLARAIAQEMKLSKDQVEAIRLSAQVHDLGKIYVPAEILNKPGQLLEEEFNLIKVHPKIAYDILKPINFPWPIAEIVYQHHERINGKGYPRNISGDEIYIEARILNVADVVEAMASHRPYRPALGIKKALDEIKNNKGILYDANVVDACLNLFENKGFEF